MRNQRGAFLVIAIIALVTIGIVGIAAMTMNAKVDQSRRYVGAETQFGAIQSALVSYVSANGRLPCPANGTQFTGRADPESAAPNCNAANGVVPWTTLGLSRDAVIDAWGNLISYRVFAGTTGLTQTDGASMAMCDTVEDFPQGVASNGLCFESTPGDQTKRDSAPTEYLASKGLMLTNAGSAVSDAAYVLISHGPTGRGGFSSGGLATAATATSGDEFSNTRPTGPFVRKSSSAVGTDPASAAHFDDLVAYETISNLITKAGHVGRDWADPATAASTTFNAATLTAAIGAPVTSGQNLGTNTITIDATVITGISTTDSTLNLGTANSTEGIGVGGTSNIQAGSEALQIQFGVSGKKFAFTLNGFGSGTFSGIDYKERVQVEFFNGATAVGTPIIKYSCNLSNPLASFSVEATGIFDRVIITPLEAEPAVGLSSFFLSAVRICAASETSCVTTLSAPANDCP